MAGSFEIRSDLGSLLNLSKHTDFRIDANAQPFAKLKKNC